MGRHFALSLILIFLLFFLPWLWGEPTRAVNGSDNLYRGHGARRGGGTSGGTARRAKCRRLHRQEPEAEHSRRRPAAADGYGELSHGGGAGGDARGL